MLRNLLRKKGGVAEPRMGADLVWWLDWSSKPAGVGDGLGGFDSHPLPPLSTQGVRSSGSRLATEQTRPQEVYAMGVGRSFEPRSG